MVTQIARDVGLDQTVLKRWGKLDRVGRWRQSVQLAAGRADHRAAVDTARTQARDDGARALGLFRPSLPSLMSGRVQHIFDRVDDCLRLLDFDVVMGLGNDAMHTVRR